MNNLRHRAKTANHHLISAPPYFRRRASGKPAFKLGRSIWFPDLRSVRRGRVALPDRSGFCLNAFRDYRFREQAS
jgi:hypothetical protein